MRNTRKIAIIIHGFNVRDQGEKTTDTLRRYFEKAGYKVMEFDYDWTGVLKVRLCNGSLATALASLLKDFDVEWEVVGVGHSNGCAILNEACKRGAPFYQLVYINPALDSDAKLAPQVSRAHVWYSPSDKPVKIARWLINHSWGEMGATGYMGGDPRYINYNKEHGYDVSSKEHSDVFKYEKLKFFGPKIVEKLGPVDC